MAILEIHEFSTGIHFDGTPGEWRSQGFSGEYMNSTLPEIPEPVEMAIKNREFKVAEGASREKPAIIGREVESNGEAWSVIAVVTRGRDEGGRGASLYRFFLCKGKKKLHHILWWYMREAGEPIFNPSDCKEVNQFSRYEDDETKINDYIPPELEKFLQQETPVIIPQKQPPHAPLIIHKVALQTPAAKNDELISWAYNVEALERSDRFLVIYPASEQAEQLIRQAKASVPQLIPAIPEENQIKTAIKNSCRTGRVDGENLQVIENALKNPKIDDKFWAYLFEQEGSKSAYQDEIYNKFNIYLLTLEAIILPATLPNFLTWMQKQGKPVLQKDKKQLEHYQIVEDFSQEIYFSTYKSTSPNDNFQKLHPILEKAYQGIDIIIPKLVEKENLLDATVWLLLDKKGIWGVIFSEYCKDLKQDLELKKDQKQQKFNSLPAKILNKEYWKSYINDLDNAWSPHFIPLSQYLPIAKLFNKLKSYELSVFFYHLAQEKIPDKIYKKVRLKGDNYNLFGVEVYREIPASEQGLRNLKALLDWLAKALIKDINIPLFLIFILCLVMFLLGRFTSELTLPKFSLGLTFPNINFKFPNPFSNPAPENLENARENFETTNASIEKLKSDFMVYSGVNISQKLIQILDPNKSLKFKTIEEDKEQWIIAIMDYQSEVIKISSPTGIIQENDETYQYLKCKLLQEMELPATQKTIDICQGKGIKGIKLSTPKNGSSSNNNQKQEAKKKEKAVQEFDKDQKTKFTLTTLVKELDQAFYLSSSNISPSITVISVLAPVNDFSISFDKMTDKKDKEAWVEAIWKYQESLKARGNSDQPIDGVINYKGSTYELLKCDVVSKLGQTLNNPPAICNKVSSQFSTVTPIPPSPH